MSPWQLTSDAERRVFLGVAFVCDSHRGPTWAQMKVKVEKENKYTAPQAQNPISINIPKHCNTSGFKSEMTFNWQYSKWEPSKPALSTLNHISLYHIVCNILLEM